MNKPENVFCRVCGWEFTMENAPWFDNETPSHEICPCCGVQFGYEDDTYLGIVAYRSQWISQGAKWFTIGLMPKNWNLDEQLQNIVKKWR